MVKTLLFSATKKICYIIATFIIIGAVFVSISYLVTPLFDKHRQDFERWASGLLQTPVTIQNIEISWYRYQPEISLNAVTVLNKTSKEPLLQIQKVRVFFSIPKSIWHATFIPSSIMISGTDLNVRQSSSGEVSVQGFPAFGESQQPYQNETKMSDLLAWLSFQPRLILQDVNVRYAGFNGQKRFVTLYNLSLQNSGQNHVLLGKAILHQDIPTEATLALQWVGDTVDFKQIKAKIYLYLSGLSLSQLLKGSSWSNWQVTNGIASTKIWATWNKGNFSKIQSTFQFYNLDLYSETDKQTHKITRLSGNVGIKRELGNYVIAGDNILLDLPNHLWPADSFYISLAPDATGAYFPKVVNLGYVDLKDMQTFLFSSPWLTPSMHQLLAKLKLTGNVQGVNMLFSGNWDDYRHIVFNGQFSQVSFLPWQQFPGIKNLAGKIKWDGSQGSLSLNSNHITIQYDALFKKPILFDQVSGENQFTLDQNNAWSITIPALNLLTNDLSLDVSGKLISQPNLMPIADLKADISLQDVSHVSRYLPTRILNADLVSWIQDAFKSGELRSAKLVLQGPLNDFPFDKGNGKFSVSGKFSDINLHYAPDWPNLEHLNAQASVQGQQFQISVDSAEISRIPLASIYGEIKDLATASSLNLEIKEALIPIDLSQGVRFIQQSPLKEAMGKMFSSIALNGPAKLKLQLTVPLGAPDKTKVKGELNVNNGTIQLTPWQLKLSHIQGLLNFTESIIQAEKLQGELFNKPLELSLNSIKNSNGISLLRASIKENLDLSDLENWLKIPFSRFAKGATNANIDIDFATNEPVIVHVHSDLKGLTLDLPHEYAKLPNESRNFTSEIILPEGQQPLKMKVVYGNLLGAALVLNHKKDEFSLHGVTLQLGTGTPNWPEGGGLYITGNFDKLDGEKITAYLDQSEKSNFSQLKLRNIDIHANVATLFGQEFKDLHVQAQPSQSDWDIKIDSANVIGHINLPQQFTPQGFIKAQFQKLDIHPVSASEMPSKINVKSLPSISIIADNVSYNKMPLGQVTLKASSYSDGLDIKTLRILSSRMDLQATGNWTEKTTHLQGTVNSRRVSDLLESFGFDVHNFIAGNAGLNFDLNWLGAFYAPSLSSMSGRASLDVGAGRIVDIGEEGGAKMDFGRMLSLFSLQSIPRRLSLDFSDVFQKGYSFDSVRGDFSFEDGNAYTNNFRFNGPLAAVLINGRIGFNTKDYDLILSITPHVSSVTSGLPVAATIIGGPVGGVAALAVNTVVGSAVSQAATHRYAVRGPWSNPKWVTVSANRR